MHKIPGQQLPWNKMAEFLDQVFLFFFPLQILSLFLGYVWKIWLFSPFKLKYLDFLALKSLFCQSAPAFFNHLCLFQEMPDTCKGIYHGIWFSQLKVTLAERLFCSSKGKENNAVKTNYSCLNHSSVKQWLPTGRTPRSVFLHLQMP